MKKGNWQIILSVTVFFGIGYLIWLGMSFFFTALATADAKISAAIIGAMTTVFVSISAVIITQRQTKAREVEEAHRAKKVEIYEKFIKTVTSIVAGENDEVSMQAPSQQELIDYLVDFKTEIMLWGSPEVIKAQLEFERVSKNGGDIFEAVNNLYKSIRKDIGLSNSGLNNLELIKLYLKDPNELDELRALGASK